MASDGRRRPMIPVLVESLDGNQLIVDALIDTGSDITLFPHGVAAALAIDLSAAPEEPLTSALGIIASYRQSEVILQLRRSPSESLKWRTTVGFLPRNMAYSILGTKGFFEFFFFGYNVQAGEIEINPCGDLPT